MALIVPLFLKFPKHSPKLWNMQNPRNMLVVKMNPKCLIKHRIWYFSLVDFHFSLSERELVLRYILVLVTRQRIPHIYRNATNQ